MRLTVITILLFVIALQLSDIKAQIQGRARAIAPAAGGKQ